LVWMYIHGKWPEDMLDHINGIKTDNRIDNLREANFSINNQNRRTAPSSNKSSGLLGVYWHKRDKKWSSSLKVNKKRMHLGNFDNKYDAYRAYLEAKRKYHPGCTI